MKTREVCERARAPGELAHGLAHEARLQANEAVAHLALDFGLGNQRGHRVDDDHVQRARADQLLADIERLLAGVGLTDEQLIEVDAQLARVDRVQRVLGVDIGDRPAGALGLGDHVQGQRGLARGLGAEDLDHPPARHSADPQGNIQRDGACADGRNIEHRVIAKLHD